MPFGSPRTASAVEDDLVAKMGDDPWSLDQQDRQHLRARCQDAQRDWLPRLQRLVEPPLPLDSFPAFLLELPPFARLRRAIGSARHIADLDVGTADELQRFVDRYRSYFG